jgi:hypothetical protein
MFLAHFRIFVADTTSIGRLCYRETGVLPSSDDFRGDQWANEMLWAIAGCGRRLFSAVWSSDPGWREGQERDAQLVRLLGPASVPAAPTRWWALGR